MWNFTTATANSINMGAWLLVRFSAIVQDSQLMFKVNSVQSSHTVYTSSVTLTDRLCGLVVRVSGYRYRGLGFDSRRYQIF